MTDLRQTISDLFFNSKEAENISWEGKEFEASAQAQEWLDNYPYFKQFITADELAKDFLDRL